MLLLLKLLLARPPAAFHSHKSALRDEREEVLKSNDDRKQGEGLRVRYNGTADLHCFVSEAHNLMRRFVSHPENALTLIEQAESATR